MRIWRDRQFRIKVGSNFPNTNLILTYTSYIHNWNCNYFWGGVGGRGLCSFWSVILIISSKLWIQMKVWWKEIPTNVSVKKAWEVLIFCPIPTLLPSTECKSYYFGLSSLPFVISVPVHNDTGKFQHSWQWAVTSVPFCSWLVVFLPKPKPKQQQRGNQSVIEQFSNDCRK